MDTLSFVAQLIDSLAWPIMVLLAFLFLRNPIASQLQWLTRVKYKEFEAEFSRQIEAARQELQLEPGDETAVPSSPESQEYIQELAAASPRAAIVEAWIGFEVTATSSLRQLDVLPERAELIPFPRLLAALQQAELLFPNEAHTLKELRTLRNKAAHEYRPGIDQTSAQKFADLMRNLSESVASRAWEKMPKSC